MITLKSKGPAGVGWMNVQVVLPRGFRNFRHPLPFVILLDSQDQWTNRGAYGGWHTDSIAMHLMAKKSLRPIVLIGVTSSRFRDSCSAPPPDGRAHLLVNHLADALIPELRKRFRLTTNRDEIGILGASLGANLAIIAGLFRPDVFGLCASFSAAPHFGESPSAMLAKRKHLPMKRLYIDCGTRWAYDDPFNYGGDNTKWNAHMMTLASHRLPKSHFRGRVFKGHFHNEEWWRKRVGRALCFLFGRGR
jgi:S-formylglutathione hydrolase FrmB